MVWWNHYLSLPDCLKLATHLLNSLIRQHKGGRKWRKSSLSYLVTWYVLGQKGTHHKSFQVIPLHVVKCFWSAILNSQIWALDNNCSSRVWFILSYFTSKMYSFEPFNFSSKKKATKFLTLETFRWHHTTNSNLPSLSNSSSYISLHYTFHAKLEST